MKKDYLRNLILFIILGSIIIGFFVTIILINLDRKEIIENYKGTGFIQNTGILTSSFDPAYATYIQLDDINQSIIIVSENTYIMCENHINSKIFIDCNIRRIYTKDEKKLLGTKIFVNNLYFIKDDIEKDNIEDD
jgi:hypothetical protein